MLVILHRDSTKEQCAAVEAAIRRLGHEPLLVPGENRTAICVTGNKAPIERAALAHLPGVLDCISVTKPFKLVSREVHPDDTIVRVSTAEIGGGAPVLIAGPCSVETEVRTLEVAAAVKAAGAQLFRAGAFKPRTNPYSFQGLGREGLRTLQAVREETGLPVVSEVLDCATVDVMAEHVDVLQVGTRNMQNFALLKRLGKIARPVLLKRGMSATLDEWLMAAEYIVAGGNRNVVLCERGIRTFSQHSRHTLDLGVVPLVRRLSHLPVIVDPSHGTGRRRDVRPLARAALAAGACGLIVETHVAPDESYTDGDQTIDIATFEGITRDAALLAQLEGVEREGAALV